jgi:rRNA biogenesis protein RRP5
VEPGQKKKVVVLHVDMLKLEVHVSLHQDLVNRKTRKVSSRPRPISTLHCSHCSENRETE